METLMLPLAIRVVDDPRVMVNERVSFRDFDEVRVVFVDGHLLYRYVRGDRAAEAFLLGTLAHSGLAGPVDLARAFEVDRATVYRYRKRLEAEGAQGVFPKKRGPKGPHTITGTMRKHILRMKERGLSNCAVGRRLGISEGSVRRVLRDVGYSTPEPPSLPGFVEVEEQAQDGAEGEEGTLVPTKASSPPDGMRPVEEAVAPRQVERVLARFGEILEAPAQPEAGQNLRLAGVLLAVPAILDLGVLERAKEVYRALKPGFYGLRSLVLTLLFMALLRIKRPEGLKGLPPEVLGRHLGLDRSPEVKTVRRKLTEIARRRKSHEFLSVIAKGLAAEHRDTMGFLYVDGHVRAYHGKREREKTLVPRKRICMPATTDYWVNDAAGDPFFFVTAEAHSGLAVALPGLLEQLKRLLGEKRKVTVVFDRGGWKPALFKTIRDEFGYDFITYRKRPYEDLPEDAFSRFTVKGREKDVLYDLSDTRIQLGKAGTVRLVVRLDAQGKQVQIVTSREDLTPVEVVQRMVDRWRQENFFKYMRREYALDALVSYEMVLADPERSVVNPKRREIDKRVLRQRRKVKKIEQQLAARATGTWGVPMLVGIPTAVQELKKPLGQAREELRRLLERRAAIPKRVPLRQALEHQPMRLEFERKTFVDTLRMMAYRAESGLVAAVAPRFRRAHHEARKLICEALQASGDIVIEKGTMHVRLEPLSSPRRTAALRHLCAVLSEQRAHYPGTSLTLTYSVRSH
jgi:prepilin-type processing-associated H-X9-DG protein